MRFLITALSLALTSTVTLAQRADNGSGENPFQYKRPLKLVPGVTNVVRSVPVRRGYASQGEPASTNRAADISQVSALPFQASFATSLTYYESCPLVLGNGNLLVVYAGSNPDTLYSLTSTDSGTTWSSPSFVAASTVYRYISGIRTAQGRLIIMSSGGYVSNGTYYGLTMCYSDNEGVSWTSPPPITNNLGDFYSTVSQTLDGTLWLGYTRYDGATGYDVFCRTSTDNGTTWSAEKTILATTNAEFYVTFISKDTSTIIAFVSDNSGGTQGIDERTSTDGGASWSSSIAVANTSTGDTRPRVLRQSDGTLWLVYQHYRPCTGGMTQSEIAYKKSTDGGTSWSAMSYLTNYAGYDGWLNACLLGNQPFVTFASYRWCTLQGQTHLWYGLIGTSSDSNTPPTLLYSYNAASGQNNQSIVAYVGDAAAVSNVRLWYHLNGVPYGPVQMYDDGLHGDYLAGDTIYGASIGPFHIDDIVDYSIEMMDINTNDLTVYGYSFSVPAVHSAGNIILQISSNSELGDLGLPGAGAHWPKTNGYDYLYDGGLWVGCTVGAQNVVVKEYYGNVGAWSRTAASSFTLGPGVSDQDGDMTYDDIGALQRIGLQVHQQSYQWSQSTRSDFIIFKYTITNTGLNGTLNNLYAGLWTDPDVAVQTNPFSDSAGYDSQRHMVYAYNTLNNPAGYFGVKLLGPATAPSTVYSWRSGVLDNVAINTPYQILTQGGTTMPDSIGDVRMMLVATPFSLASNSSKTVQFGIVLGNGLSGLQANADTMEAVFESKLATSIAPPWAGDGIPKEFSLSQNYPNPFNPSTTIRYGLPQRSNVTLAVYNTLGQIVSNLAGGTEEAGYHEVKVDGSGLASGVYFYRIEAGSFVQTKKLMILR